VLSIEGESYRSDNLHSSPIVVMEGDFRLNAFVLKMKLLKNRRMIRVGSRTVILALRLMSFAGRQSRIGVVSTFVIVVFNRE